MQSKNIKKCRYVHILYAVVPRKSSRECGHVRVTTNNKVFKKNYDKAKDDKLWNLPVTLAMRDSAPFEMCWVAVFGLHLRVVESTRRHAQYVALHS